MKKLLAILLTSAFALVITACNNAQDPIPPRDTTDRQQTQQTGGAQNADASQDTIGQQADTIFGGNDAVAPAPEVPAAPALPPEVDFFPEAPEVPAVFTAGNLPLFHEFIADYASVSRTSRQGLIGNGIAFWHVRNVRGYIIFLHDINTGSAISIDHPVWYMDGYLFALTGGIGGNQRLIRLDLQGNIVDEYFDEYHETNARFRGLQIRNGLIFVTVGRATAFISPFNRVLSASDFSVIQEQIKFTVDIGHGRTEDIVSFGFTIMTDDDKVYVGGSNELHLFNLRTGEGQEVDRAASPLRVPGTSSLVGRFSITGYGGITKAETGERLDGVLFDDHFTGTNFHQVWGQEVQRFNLNTGQFDTIFVAPNNNTTFVILDDEYIIVRDRVGSFLYRIVAGNVNGELVIELEVPPGW